MHRASASAKQARLAALGPDKPEKDEILLAFGKNLRSLRIAARLSQDKLARRCFLRHDDVSHIERGVRTPSLTMLFMLAHTLGASVAHLTVADQALPSWYVVELEVTGEIACQPSGWRQVHRQPSSASASTETTHEDPGSRITGIDSARS